MAGVGFLIQAGRKNRTFQQLSVSHRNTPSRAAGTAYLMIYGSPLLQPSVQGRMGGVKPLRPFNLLSMRFDLKRVK